MPDRLFSLPRLAAVYDALDPDRADLDVYADLLRQLGARSVMDVGCGTGSLAVMLASRGLRVIGVDPAQASLDLAASKPGGDRVTWVCADATSLPADHVDAVTMTGNVAQVFVDDHEWAAALRAAWRVLRPGGHLVFESRRPEAQAWQAWTREHSYRTAAICGEVVERWFEVTDVTARTVSFDARFVFSSDGAELTSASTLRFRTAEELRESLSQVGFGEPTIRDAPDRPGLENVFLARR